jgi:hypothetical protein
VQLGAQPAAACSQCLILRVCDPLFRSSPAGAWRAPAACWWARTTLPSIRFCSLQEQIDTTTPGGKLVFHVFAALAEFERDLVRERTSAGLAAARARGRRGGRPSVMTMTQAQAPGGAQDVSVQAVHGGGDRQDPRGERASIYRHLARAGG